MISSDDVVPQCTFEGVEGLRYLLNFARPKLIRDYFLLAGNYVVVGKSSVSLNGLYHNSNSFLIYFLKLGDAHSACRVAASLNSNNTDVKH
jgi:hypothetical protein